jgi:hypothetical protein
MTAVRSEFSQMKWEFIILTMVKSSKPRESFHFGRIKPKDSNISPQLFETVTGMYILYVHYNTVHAK